MSAVVWAVLRLVRLVSMVLVSSEDGLALRDDEGDTRGELTRGQTVLRALAAVHSAEGLLPPGGAILGGEGTGRSQLSLSLVPMRVRFARCLAGEATSAAERGCETARPGSRPLVSRTNQGRRVRCQSHAVSAGGIEGELGSRDAYATGIHERRERSRLRRSQAPSP